MTLVRNYLKVIFQSYEFELIINHDMPANKFRKFLSNNVSPIAIYNDDELMIPHGDTLIEAGQDILAFGMGRQLEDC